MSASGAPAFRVDRLLPDPRQIGSSSLARDFGDYLNHLPAGYRLHSWRQDREGGIIIVLVRRADADA